MSALDAYFLPQTMSLHIKAGTYLRRKVGSLAWVAIVTDESKLRSSQDCQDLITCIETEMQGNPDSFLEITKAHFRVIQHGLYRIVIVMPPLADAIELTIVRPLTKLTLQDYALTPSQSKHLLDTASGILVSGAPGSGKSTFVQALGDRFSAQGKIIKTIESPRDLQVADDVVQYSYSHASHSDIRDILLLSRPDISLYDEVRNREDFLLFSDLRLTGIGLIGVIHATKPIDSVQRFLKIVDMGIIPQVVDTVVFMAKGKIETIYTLEMTVKVPDGMMSEDLARPVVVIRDLDTGKDCYEIYTYGEQLVVQPLGQASKKGKPSPLAQLALGSVRDFFAQELDVEHVVLMQGSTVMLYVRDEHKGRVIGRGGERIQVFERKLGLSISVKDLDQLPIVPAPAQLVDVNKNRVVYGFDPQQYAGTSIVLYVGNRLDERWIDECGHLVITEKYLIKKIQRDGLMIVE